MSKLKLAAMLASAIVAVPVHAEVIEADAAGFVTRDTAEVQADAKDVWLALISPAKWWNSAHTWSGDAANLTLKPQAGGCFCERIPEDLDVDRPTLEGSVEHMRVIQAYPERALRLQGALGPLQSEAVNGVLTIALAETPEGTTRIAWEYVVGGKMRYEVPVISKAVDGVMSQQLAGLATLLGPVEAQPPAAEPQAEESAETAPESGQESAEPTLEEAIDAMAQG